ncbi:hypothetical protein DM02DRAFT_397452 [Periconia macrospinosa]|uniref:Uncharacterized protein n=1 Tax=Periconia macrospinosa TaxID=97972 RepID=A0A2V1CYR9_9PLEO|nr:hypothetical protein DM02DRAFT_397452 [Periconia macrospinosa]
MSSPHDTRPPLTEPCLCLPVPWTLVRIHKQPHHRLSLSSYLSSIHHHHLRRHHHHHHPAPAPAPAPPPPPTFRTRSPTAIDLARKQVLESSPDANPLLTWQRQRPAKQTVPAPTEALFLAFLSRLYRPP